MSELSVLVNSDNIRQSVKRLFTNKADEVWAELLQNSQRATASRVVIESFDNPDDGVGLRYRDNGHGLVGGEKGFHTLLKMAESYFENSTIDSQKPMGLGIHALLANDAVHEVTFASDYLSLTLDTRRWWTDSSYYSRWYTYLESVARVNGLEITVKCTKDFVYETMEAFGAKRPYSWEVKGSKERVAHFQEGRLDSTIAVGYRNIMSVHFDGTDVVGEFPEGYLPAAVFSETRYKGAKLTVGYTYQGGGFGYVNWYGQIIPVHDFLKRAGVAINEKFKDYASGLRFYMEVLDGSPVNPIAPSRKSLIEDESYKELVHVIVEEAVKFICNIENHSKVHPIHILMGHAISREKVRQDCPWYVVQQHLPYRSLDSRDADDLGDYEKALYPQNGQDGLFLLASDFYVVGQDEPADSSVFSNDSDVRAYEKGKGFLLDEEELPSCYKVCAADMRRLNVHRLYWRPGEPIEGNTVIDDTFYEKGVYGLAKFIGEDNYEVKEWHDVCADVVIAYDGKADSIYDIDAVVGCSSVVQAVKSEEFDVLEDEEADYEDDQEHWYDSISRFMRELVGNAVSRDFTTSHLQYQMKDSYSKILSVIYNYSDISLISVTVKNAAGETKELKIVD